VSTAAFGGLQMVVHVDEIWNLARGGYARSRERPVWETRVSGH
jgi:hypothetical protein